MSHKLTKTEQLRIIQGLTYLCDDGPQTYENCKKIMEEIYRIAHLNGTCKNPHLDWHKEGIQTQATLRKIGLI